MPQDESKITKRRVQLVFALLLACIFYAQFAQKDNKPVINTGTPTVLAAEEKTADRFERLVRSNPLEALIYARESHTASIRDYRCTMVKQELLPSGLSAEQEIEAVHRLTPYSVVLNWKRNPGLASRVIYVEGKWVKADEESPELQAQALAQPENSAARLLVPSIKIPIHGMAAKRTARRAIDEFGFKRTLDLLIQYCQIANTRNELKLEFLGEKHFDGRPVWVIRRHLPYTGESGIYPDRTAEIYVDKEFKLPIAVYCYSDDAMRPENLLGKYEYRDIQLNVEISDKVFDPATYGM